MNTSFYAGILAIIYVLLAVHVVRGRIKFKVGLGHGNNDLLDRRIRMHGNFAEYVPLSLLIIYFNELSAAPLFLINILGSALVIGRLAHVQGLTRSDKESPGRALGTIFTFGVLLVGGVRLLIVNLF